MPGSERSYGAYLEARERDGLRRGLTGIEARDARTIRIGKEAYVNFASNDYLALRFHPALIERAKAFAEALWRGVRRFPARHRQPRSASPGSKPRSLR